MLLSAYFYPKLSKKHQSAQSIFYEIIRNLITGEWYIYIGIKKQVLSYDDEKRAVLKIFEFCVQLCSDENLLDIRY